MKHIFFMVLAVMMGAEAQEQVSVSARGREKVGLLIGIIDDISLVATAQLMAHDLQFRNYCNVSVRMISKDIQRTDLRKLADEKFAVALILSSNDASIEFRMYDTSRAHMIKGTRYHKQTDSERVWAHAIADMVWPTLTGLPGVFSTRIAYCVKQPKKNGSHETHIYCADFDGLNSEPVVKGPGIHIAPRWNSDVADPLIFYSTYGSYNMPLMAVRLDKKVKVVSNFDGINMLPSFSSDGKSLVYCASRGGGACHIYFYQKGALKKISNNTGNNVSPILSPDGGTIYYCSDFQTGLPQIYRYTIANNTIDRLTEGGFCACPAYNEARNQLAYTKIVNGLSQVFVVDLVSKEHTQLTFDASNKDECSWSPCGSMVLFSSEQGGKSRIALFDMISKKMSYVSPEGLFCSYPSWSPRYATYPLIS